MARVKFGAMMVDARGKLGGHVFTKARSGATIRTKVTPLNGQTSAQGAVRSTFGTLSQSWRTLSEEQRIAWNNKAATVGKTNVFGDSYFPSGKNLYVAINTNILNAGGSAIKIPPVDIALPDVLLSGITFDSLAQALEVELQSLTNPTGNTALVFCSPCLSKGVFNASGKERFVSAVNLTGTSTVADIYADYVAKYGALLSGSKIFVKVKIVNASSGQSSPWFSESIIIDL